MKNSTAFGPADILIPKDTDMTRWACIACDQYTSDRGYWEKASEFVGEAPSALRLILPEAFLNDSDVEQRIQSTHKAMNEYLEKGLFTEYKDSFIYVRRTDSTGAVREGLVGMIDLEAYDYSKGSSTPVRATEATVPERIPPRLKVRMGAPLELPHIMILIDDPDRTVIEPLADKSLPTVYDFPLYGSAGKIEGRLVKGEAAQQIDSALAHLADRDVFEKKYGISGVSPLVYAMGDGNHSLATAKAYYMAKKEEGGLPEDPACRYALCEIVNLHSPALEFEAIHRIVTGVDREKFISEMTAALGLAAPEEGKTVIAVTDGREERNYTIGTRSSNLDVGCVQGFIDDYLKANGGEVDYIHGADVVRELAAKGGVGILLPDMAKDELFRTVILDGALPRKTFSMGHADDKRFYVEARKIR